MQNKQIGKGADKKSYCALFLRDQADACLLKTEIETKHRRALADAQRHYRPQILVAGYCGLFAAAELAADHADEVRAQFPAWLPAQIRQLYEKQCADNGCLMTQRIGEALSPLAGTVRITEDLPAMLFPLGEGGIYKGLWELGETLFCGIETRLSDIPMKQSIIEICNLYQINPYKEDSQGSCLLLCNHAQTALRILAEQKIPAAVIGEITEGADRIMEMPEGISHLGSKNEAGGCGLL